VYLYDPSCSVIVMELLDAPNIILRHAIVKGEVYPAVAAHVGAFLASTLFNTSLLALDSAQFRWGGGGQAEGVQDIVSSIRLAVPA
jgi:5-methylthioribose kinase